MGSCFSVILFPSGGTGVLSTADKPPPSSLHWLLVPLGYKHRGRGRLSFPPLEVHGSCVALHCPSDGTLCIGNDDAQRQPRYHSQRPLISHFLATAWFMMARSWAGGGEREEGKGGSREATSRKGPLLLLPQLARRPQLRPLAPILRAGGIRVGLVGFSLGTRVVSVRAPEEHGRQRASLIVQAQPRREWLRYC